MFGGQFSLGKFSLGRQELDFEIRARFHAAFWAAADVGKNVPADAGNYASLEGRLVLTPGIPVGFAGEAAVNARAGLMCKVPVTASAAQSLGAVCGLGKNIWPRLEFPARLEASAYFGKDMWRKLALPAELRGNLWLAKNIPAVFSAGAILNALASIYTLDNETMEISVEVPPGGRLYIDCDHFNILLNGENILHLHKGGWIHLDRDMIRLVIDSGTGGPLSGNLVVTERFL